MENAKVKLQIYIYLYYAHLASVRFEHSVCRGSIMTTYIYTDIFLSFYPEIISYLDIFFLNRY